MTGAMTRWREVISGGIAMERGLTCLSRSIAPCTSFGRYFLVGLAEASSQFIFLCCDYSCDGQISQK